MNLIIGQSQASGQLLSKLATLLASKLVPLTIHQTVLSEVEFVFYFVVRF
jgi:hypothetical protein